MQLKEAMNEVKLHRVKCYNIQARKIKQIAYCKELKKVAVLRNDFSIEIWNCANSLFIERVIPGSINNTVEQICWAGSRLFSVGISNEGVTEWDLRTLSPKKTLLLTGEKGICMDYNEETELLAIGTAEGIINIFTLSNDDFQYVSILDRQDQQIMCCKFNDTGEFIVSGSIDAVKIWNVKTGHVVQKMSTARESLQHETIIWCVEVLKDFTIITGDSRGRVTFWDGNLGSQIDWIQASNNDIMCLALSEDENYFFCSGTEQAVRKYSRITSHKTEQWIRCAKRFKLHTHDILSMEIIGDNYLLSGGIDGFLTICNHELALVEKLGPFLKHPFVSIADEARLIFMMYSNYLELWKLAEASDQSNDQDEDEAVCAASSTFNYKIKEFPEKLLELRSNKDESVICSAISNNGKWISYSTTTSIRLFHFEVENSKPALLRVKSTPDEFTPCSQMIFTKDSTKLLTIDVSGKCTIFDLTTGDLDVKQIIDTEDHHTDLIHLVATSSCSKYIVFGSLCNRISIWQLQKGKYGFKKMLPKYSSPATALSIHRNLPLLTVALSDGKVYKYDMKECAIEFSIVTDSSCNMKSSILSLCSDPRNENTITFTQNNSINVIRRESDEEAEGGKKLKSSAGAKEIAHKMSTAKKFDTLLIHLEWLGDNELVALEMNPVALTENLPAPLKRKVFGVN